TSRTVPGNIPPDTALFPLATSHMRMVLYTLAASCLLSGENTSPRTGAKRSRGLRLLCTVHCRRSRPLAAFHRNTVSSEEAASSLPSGEAATEWSTSPDPLNDRTNRRVVTSHISKVRGEVITASRLPG